MPLTVAELVGQPQLGLRVVAGATGADAVIRWGHASELLDPSPWLRGGELLLTTGMALPPDGAEHAAYLHRLADAGVAGVGFGVGVHAPAAPSLLVEAAEARGLPLLEVPLPVPFIAITEAIAARHAAEQQETTQRLVEVMRAMTRAALRHGASGVLRVLTGSLGGSAAVLDEYGGVLAEAGGAVPALLADGREELARRGGGQGPFSVTVSGTGGRLLLQSIGGGSRPRGHLLLHTDAEWSAFAQLSLAQANSLLSITVEKPDVVLTAERRLRAEVLALVLDGARPAEVSGQLSAFGFAGDACVVALALEPETLPRDDGRERELAEATSRVLERESAAQLVAVRDGRVIVLLGGGGGGGRGGGGEGAAGGSAGGAADEEALLAEVGRVTGCRVLVGISTPQPLDRAVDAVTQAGFALRAARSQRRRSCRFADLSTYALLLAAQSREALTMVADVALQPVLDHDRRRGTQLLVTLEVFLTHNAQAAPAAAALGVHRHTLRNRIRKVTELTGRDLDSPHDRTELWLALKAREIARLGPGR